MEKSYRNLLAYKQAKVIFDLTYLFCAKYLIQINQQRTVVQMQQAARSGKQNLVEGALEKSMKMYIKLAGVGRASFGELLEDYEDYIRVNKLTLWSKNDYRLAKIRARNFPYDTYVTYFTSDPEYFCNLMITLLNKENYILDRLIAVLEEKFQNEGGYSEKLYNKRINRRNRQI